MDEIIFKSVLGHVFTFRFGHGGDDLMVEEVLQYVQIKLLTWFEACTICHQIGKLAAHRKERQKRESIHVHQPHP